MSYLEISGEKKYLFGKDGAKDLAKKMGIKFLADVPLIEGIGEVGSIDLSSVIKELA
jgi:ATP-binding protein involved in chromosome partitioning